MAGATAGEPVTRTHGRLFELEHLQANIPNCTVELIPDTGHWVHVEPADQVKAAIATFLHTLR